MKRFFTILLKSYPYWSMINVDRNQPSAVKHDSFHLRSQHLTIWISKAIWVFYKACQITGLITKYMVCFQVHHQDDQCADVTDTAIKNLHSFDANKWRHLGVRTTMVSPSDAQKQKRVMDDNRRQVHNDRSREKILYVPSKITDAAALRIKNDSLMRTENKNTSCQRIKVTAGLRS